MAAQPGNQFWKLRSKHGRDKIFSSPEAMWEAACEYFEWIDANPFTKSEAKTVNIGDFHSKIELAELPIMRPYTIQGLCRHMHVNTKYLYDFEEAKHEGFSEILTRIRDTIYEQKFSGAASGFLNANIIARDLGLTDKKELDHKGIPETKITYEVAPQVTPDE